MKQIPACVIRWSQWIWRSDPFTQFATN